MEFPHLKDNGYPYLNKSDVYSQNPAFDYSRYDYAATVRLMRVTWDRDYRHTVNWAGFSERDDWFTQHTAEVIDISNGFTHVQLDRVRVDVPQDVVLTYNYVEMIVPQLTEDTPIRNESADGMRHIFAFIVGSEYLAPNTTELHLQLDVWTTYLPHLCIDGMMLERGHAPMWDMDADTYLSDPIDNCANLLTPDVDFGHGAIVKDTHFEPLVTGDLMLVIATTIPYSAIDSIARAFSEVSSAPTYSDLEQRNGHQVWISDFKWAWDHNYQGMWSPADVANVNGTMLTPVLYAIDGAKVNAALSAIADVLPVFITSAIAAYVLPKALLTIGTKHTVGTAELFECVADAGYHTLTTFTIDKDYFGYAEPYANIAKLYTFPYAHIELSDEMGNDLVIRVEDTDGTIEVQQQLSAAWPTLSWDAMVTNVASVSGDVAYTWRKLDGTTESLSLPGAAAAVYTLKFGIPTYSLYLSRRVEAAMESWFDGQQARREAVTDYQDRMRTANNSYENTLDDTACDVANTNDTNATNVTNTAATGATNKGNAYRSADTSKSNADDSADTVYGNALRSNARTRTNAYDSADVTFENIDDTVETSTDTMENNIAFDDLYKGTGSGAGQQGRQYAYDNTLRSINALYRATKTSIHNGKLHNDLARANRNIQDVQDAQFTGDYHKLMIDTAASMFKGYAHDSIAVAKTIGGMATGDANSFLGAAPQALDIAENITQWGIDALAASATMNVDHTTVAGINALTQQFNTDLLSYAEDEADKISGNGSGGGYTTSLDYVHDKDIFDLNSDYRWAAQVLKDALERANNTLVNGRTGNNQDPDGGYDGVNMRKAWRSRRVSKSNALGSETDGNANALDTRDTAKANATLSRDTSKSNALDSETTGNDNATRSANTSDANAARTKAKTDANAFYTRETIEENAKYDIEMKQARYMTGIMSKAILPPVQHGAYAGDASYDALKRKGVSMRIVTEDESAIRRAGDEFIRYGYRFDGFWRVDGNLHPYDDAPWCYWQAKDLSMTCNTLPVVAEDGIRTIMSNGTTVWNDPDHVGSFLNYDQA